jgi:DNA-binding IclR family transcriptional regulator
MRTRWGDGATRVLLAAVADRQPTYTTIMARTGLSRETIHRQLHHLRDDGLIAFDDGKHGTIRALVGRLS